MNGIAPGTVTQPSDVELAAAGDVSAFGRIVAVHHADLIRIAYVITGDQSHAQDAVQTAWISAWKKLGSVRDATKVRAWLTSIAVNEARQILRRQRRAVVVDVDPQARAPRGSDPGVGIARLDLIRALDRLTPEDRALLALRYVAGLEAGELGALTGRSASGTRARLSRLTARLRKELDGD